MTSASSQIASNIRIHDRVARRYDKLHCEIFNPIEQDRLAKALAAAKGAIRGSTAPLRALDFGAGSGNLTRHLLDLDMAVTAADVSPHFLQLVRYRHGHRRLDTHQLNGVDLRAFADGSFDFIASYSVLHHVPDYLGAVAEFGRVCAPGGVIFIDHERTDGYWRELADHRLFEAEARRFDWRKYTRPGNYLAKLRRLFDPKYANEGDIHVWPDDHIEWPRIVAVLAAHGCEPIVTDAYLNYSTAYRDEVFTRWKDRLTDTQLMVFQKV